MHTSNNASNKLSKIENEWVFDFKEFPREEYQERYTKSRKLMHEQGIDLLIITDQINCRYFTGFKGRTFNRPAFVILPIDDEPILIASKDLGARDARMRTWVKEIVEYELPVTQDPISIAIKRLKKRPRTIGMETDDSFFGGFRPALSYRGYKKLISEFNGLEFEDASHLIWKLRMIKTKREIDCIKTACNILKKSYTNVFSNIHEGMTEEEIAASLLKHMINEGADLPDIGRQGPSAMIIIDASRPSDQPHIPTKKPLNKGDLLHIDTGAVFKGYYSDFACSGVIGQPSKTQLDLWNIAVDKVALSMEKIKPGIKGKEICVHWHGVGLNYVEAPFRGLIGKGIHGELEFMPGMTLCLEEVITASNGETFHFEELILITEKNYDNLSCAERKLLVV